MLNGKSNFPQTRRYPYIGVANGSKAKLAKLSFFGTFPEFLISFSTNCRYPPTERTNGTKPAASLIWRIWLEFSSIYAQKLKEMYPIRKGVGERIKTFELIIDFAPVSSPAVDEGSLKLYTL